MEELLEAANELLNEKIDYRLYPEKIPDDKELWICCNDPDLDELFKNDLLPKGAQDKTKILLAQIHENQRKNFQYQQEMQKQWDKEYHDFFDKYDIDDDLDIPEFIDDIENNIDEEDNDIIPEAKEIIVNEEIVEKPNMEVLTDKKPFIKPEIKDDKIKLTINPDLSATKNFIKVLMRAEPFLNDNQKMQFLDYSFTKQYLGISLPLLKSYTEKSERFINGHSRYISKPIIFNNQQWLLTNNIYKKNVEKLIDVLNNFIEKGKDI